MNTVSSLKRLVGKTQKASSKPNHQRFTHYQRSGGRQLSGNLLTQTHVTNGSGGAVVKRKGKKEYLYSAFYILCIQCIAKRLGMDHTVLPANTPCLPFFRKRSPDGATSN